MHRLDPAFRLDQALEQTGGEELVGIVLEQGPEHLVAALSARERGDAPVLEAATHKLRGAVTRTLARELEAWLALQARRERRSP